MTAQLISAELAELLDGLVMLAPELEAIWMIGSRANETATDSSDWDFIAFGNQAALDRIRKAEQLHKQNVDFMVVTNGDDFRNAWGKKEKTGSLQIWEWTPVSDTLAEYTQTKERKGDSFYVDSSRKNAIKVWSCIG